MKSKNVVRIMAFGTFDIIHKGHENFFKQARALADKSKPYLIVSLSRDLNVLRIKGRKTENSERKRLAQVKAHPDVDFALLGALGDHLPHIVKQQPDIVVLGYDQKAYTHGLRISLKRAGWLCKVVRLKSYKPRQYKTSIIKAKMLK